MNTNPLYALAENWPADLLIDYILKIHHRGIRDNGPGILARFRRAVEARPEQLELAKPAPSSRSRSSILTCTS